MAFGTQSAVSGSAREVTPRGGRWGSRDLGKPVTDAIDVDMRVVVQAFGFYVEAIDKRYDEVAPSDHRTLATTTRDPLGVVGAVVP